LFTGKQNVRQPDAEKHDFFLSVKVMQCFAMQY